MPHLPNSDIEEIKPYCLTCGAEMFYKYNHVETDYSVYKGKIETKYRSYRCPNKRWWHELGASHRNVLKTKDGFFIPEPLVI